MSLISGRTGRCEVHPVSSNHLNRGTAVVELHYYLTPEGQKDNLRRGGTGARKQTLCLVLELCPQFMGRRRVRVVDVAKYDMALDLAVISGDRAVVIHPVPYSSDPPLELLLADCDHYLGARNKVIGVWRSLRLSWAHWVDWWKHLLGVGDHVHQ